MNTYTIRSSERWLHLDSEGLWHHLSHKVLAASTIVVGILFLLVNFSNSRISQPIATERINSAVEAPVANRRISKVPTDSKVNDEKASKTLLALILLTAAHARN